MKPKGHLLDPINKIELESPLCINGDAVVTADYHVPLHDPKYINKMLEAARSRGIDQLIIAGDYWNFDAISQYHPKQSAANLEVELPVGLDVMRTLLKTFEHVYFLKGNHDYRFVKALGYKLSFAESMRLLFGGLGEKELSRITFTNLDHCWLDSGFESFYICHPGNYSSVPLKVPRDLANKLNSHVISAHCHHCAVGYSLDAEHVAIEVGGFFDYSKTEYLQESNTYPVWQQGFVIVENGLPRISSPLWETL